MERLGLPVPAGVARAGAGHAHDSLRGEPGGRSAGAPGRGRWSLVGPRQPPRSRTPSPPPLNAALGNAGDRDRLPRARRPRPSEPPGGDRRAVAADGRGLGARRSSSSAATRSTTRRPTSTSRELLRRVPNALHLSLYDDETSRRCRWHLPQAHSLEAWGDARAWDGTLQRRAAADRAALRRAGRRSSCWRPARGRAGRPAARSSATPCASSARAAGLRGVLAALPARRAGRRQRRRRRPRPSSTLDGVAAARARARAAAGAVGRSARAGASRPTRNGLRRPLRQQRLAPGAARPDDQAHLGQRARCSARPRPRALGVAARTTSSRCAPAGASVEAAGLRAARARRAGRVPCSPLGYGRTRRRHGRQRRRRRRLRRCATTRRAVGPHAA